MLKLLISISLFFGASSFAEDLQTRRIMLDYRGSVFHGGDYISLDRELRRFGYNPNRFRLNGIAIFAERGSYGRISLMTERRHQDSIRIENSRIRNGMLYGELRNYNRGYRPPWEVNFGGSRRDRVYLDRIVIDMSERSPGSWACIYTHRINKGNFQGRGRSRGEAESNARRACESSQPRVPGACEFRGCRR